jgi:rhamnosyltransferase
MSVAGSVIVRAKDEAATIERTLSLVRDQTVAVELIVVDSGSTDGTLEIARALCDRLISIPPDRFTFGRALNVGADAASAKIHFALSAHCLPERSDWVERSLRHYERPDVAATNDSPFYPDQRPLREVFYQDAATARAHPLWGFSNHAASWRASVWQQFRFSESMEACEDKEWSWRVLNAGWVIAYDPLLSVSTAHCERSGVRRYYARVEREARELAAYGDFPTFRLRDAGAEWWNGYPADSRYPPLFHRANYYRVAEIAGKYVGARRGRRGRISAPDAANDLERPPAARR